MNRNSLNDILKITAVFSKLKWTGERIYILQQTHSTNEAECQWQRYWGNRQIYFPHGSSNVRGVAVLISKNFIANVLKITQHMDGWFMIIDIERNGTIYTVGNIYAPIKNFEKEQQNTFKKFIKYMEQIPNQYTILGGDHTYNLYMISRLDKLDIWGAINPDKTFPTWHQGNQRSRLDYIFTSEHLLNYVENVTYCLESIVII